MVRGNISKYPAAKQSLQMYFQEQSSLKSYSKTDVLSKCSLDVGISQQDFVTKLHLVVPCTNDNKSEDLLPQLSTLITNYKSFIIRQLHLDVLVSYEFIQSFIKLGEVQCISEGTLLGSHDCCALYPTGRLSLLLSHHTYHALGLEGSPVTNILRKPHHRYAVHINALSPGFHPPRPGYERTSSCLRKLKMDFRVSWEPNSASVCPSSIAKYFSDLGYSVGSLISPTVRHTVLNKVPIPLISWQGKECLQQQLRLLDQENVTETPEARCDEHLETDVLSFLEDVGCLLLDIKPQSSSGARGLAEQVLCLHCDGFFSAAAVRRILINVRALHERPEMRCPWVCLSLHSHPETPFERRGTGKCHRNTTNSHQISSEKKDCGGASSGGLPCVGKCHRNTTNSHQISSEKKECGYASSGGPPCSKASCDCGMVECDQHALGAGALLAVITADQDACWFRGGSAGIRHRYYTKTSNNK